MSGQSTCGLCGGRTPCNCRVVLDRFTQAMSRELEANDRQGGRNGHNGDDGWSHASTRFLISEVLYHSAKLSYALRQYEQGEGDRESVLEFAADTANMAFMVADAAGVLGC